MAVFGPYTIKAEVRIHHERAVRERLITKESVEGAGALLQALWRRFELGAILERDGRERVVRGGEARPSCSIRPKVRVGRIGG